MAEHDLSQLKIERSAAPMRRRRRGWLRALAVATALAAGGFAWWKTQANRPLEVKTTTVTTAWPSQQVTVLTATGYVVAQRKAAVASKGTGRLEWLGVREGSRVSRGEVVARLENADVTATMQQAAAAVGAARANLAQAEAELTDAEAARRRSADLLAQKFISPASYDTALARRDKATAAVAAARAGIAQAQANLRAAEVTVEYTVIRAPFDGVVLTKHANVGDVITPFATASESKGAVVTMADMETLEVEADVSESNLSKVSMGQPCEIQLDALPDARFRGEVSSIVPTVDRSKATVMAKVRFVDRDPRTLPEMSAKVAFLSQPLDPAQQQPRTAVQKAALASRSGREVLYLVKDGIAVEAPVQLGATLGEQVELKSGAAPGARAVLDPPAGLANGMAVKPDGK